MLCGQTGWVKTTGVLWNISVTLLDSLDSKQRTVYWYVATKLFQRKAYWDEFLNRSCKRDLLIVKQFVDI